MTNGLIEWKVRNIRGIEAAVRWEPGVDRVWVGEVSDRSRGDGCCLSWRFCNRIRNRAPCQICILWLDLLLEVVYQKAHYGDTCLRDSDQQTTAVAEDKHIAAGLLELLIGNLGHVQWFNAVFRERVTLFLHMTYFLTQSQHARVKSLKKLIAEIAGKKERILSASVHCTRQVIGICFISRLAIFKKLNPLYLRYLPRLARRTLIWGGKHGLRLGYVVSKET